MKEIKFRAWRKGKMYKAETLETLLNTASVTGFSLEAPSPVIWSQFTGLKDVRGVEVYEGDILKLNNANGDTFYGEVKMLEGCWNAVFIHGHKEPFRHGPVTAYRRRNYLKCFTASYAAKIIGNIYENPELTKQIL